jgi:hypothetical protein
MFRKTSVAFLAGMALAASMHVNGAMAAEAQPTIVQPAAAPAQAPAQTRQRETFEMDEILRAGHKFFGKTTKGLARAIESVFKAHGRPTGYVLGEEASGAFVAGARYGEGWLFLKNGQKKKIFWQGPSIGYDFGGNGSKVLMLVYDIDTPREIFARYPGVSGSAYLIAGLSVSMYSNEKITLVPIRTGVGARLGANIGYLKVTERPTWNPF